MNLPSIYRAIIYIALYSILFIPFIVNSTLFFPFITGKAFTFYILTHIAFLAWILLCFKDESVRPKKGWQLWALLIFLGILTLADVFGVNSHISIWSNFERMDGLVTMIHVIVFTVILSSMIQAQNGWKHFFGTSLFASTIMSLYALFEAADAVKAGTSVVRVDTSFGNPIYLASYLLIHLFILAWFFVRTDSKFVRWFTSILAIFHVIALYYTSTRGAIVGLALGVFVTSLLIAIFAKKEKLIRLVGAIVLALMILSTGIFFATKDSSFVQNNPTLSRIANSSFSEGTGFSRYVLWTEVAPKGIAERPILGWGQGGFSVVFDKYYDPQLYHHEQWFDRSHNIFMDWLIIGGILGFLAYFGMYGVAFYLLIRHKGISVPEKAIWVGAMIAYIGQNLFVFDNLGNYILFFTLLAYIHWIDSDEKESQTFWLPPKSGPIVSIIAVVVLAVTFWTTVARPYASNADLIQAIRVTAQTREGSVVAYHGNVQVNFDLFKKIINRNPQTGIYEIKERLMHTTNEVAAITNVDEQLRAEMIQYMEEQQLSLQVLAPESTRYPFLFANYYLNRGLYEQAEEQARRAVELSPTKQFTHQVLAIILVRQQKFDEAIQVATEAYELNPEIDETWILRADTLRIANRTEELKPFVQQAFEDEHYTRLMRWFDLLQRGNTPLPDDYQQLHDQIKQIEAQTG